MKSLRKTETPIFYLEYVFFLFAKATFYSFITLIVNARFTI